MSDEDLKAELERLKAENERLKAGDWLFLAMIHQRSGNPVKAEEYYEKAVKWRQTPAHEPTASAGHRFDEWLAEAAGVLGKEQPK